MKSITKISSWKDQLDLFVEAMDTAKALNVINVHSVIHERFMAHYNVGHITRFGVINYNGYFNNAPTVVSRSLTKSSLSLWKKFPNNMYVDSPLENRSLKDSFQQILILGYTDVEDRVFNPFEFYFSWILLNTPKNILYKNCRVLE